MHEYSYLPPFVGALFEMPDGSKIVQVATLRPSYRVAEYLFFEFAEMAGELAYYQAAFEDVVQHSESQEEVTLTGRPLEPGPGFLCLGSRFRRTVLLPDRGPSSDWLPSVLVCTYWEQPGPSEPLLQLRTRENSSYEVGMLSHVSGLVYQQDADEPELTRQVEFVLPQEATERAALRVLREELAVPQERLQLELVDQLKFHGVDHESLYHFFYALALPRSISSFPEASQIRPWALGDLMQLRRHQALFYAEQLLERSALTAQQADVAARVLKLNFVLHGLGQLGEALSEQVYRRVRPTDLLGEIRRLREESSLAHPAGGGGPIRGLGRLEYREFFSSLLPLYERIGVPGAREELAGIRSDLAKEVALGELRELYRSETDMRVLATDV
jgi:ADP-ribose pyrophosphatase YjhB (NUDIX family)